MCRAHHDRKNRALIYRPAVQLRTMPPGTDAAQAFTQSSSRQKSVPNYRLRHLVPPGITGWAQVYYRATQGLEGSLEKHHYDHMSAIVGRS